MEVCRENGVGESTYYKWKSRYGDLEVNEARRLKTLDDENTRLKRLLAPVQNAHVESFNGKLRNECLNLEWFSSLPEARQVIEQWPVRYSQFRPHSGLNNMPPQG